jgi:hypothetical protein
MKQYHDLLRKLSDFEGYYVVEYLLKEGLIIRDEGNV